VQLSFDRSNLNLKAGSASKTDSVQVFPDSSIYWYRLAADTAWHIGMKQHFDKGELQKTDVYGMGQTKNLRNSIYYHYDKKTSDLLLIRAERSSNPGDWAFCYNEAGLLTQRTRLSAPLNSTTYYYIAQ